MAKFKRMEESMSIKPLLKLDKIMANKPTQIIILCNHRRRFKNSLYIALNKQRKNRAFIIREAHLPNDGGNTSEYVFSSETSHKDYLAPLRVSSLIPCIPFMAIQGFNFPNHAVVILVSLASTAVMMKLLQNTRFWKRVINLSKGAQKRFKGKPKEIKRTSVAPNPKLWTLTSDDLLVMMDAYKIEYFVYNMCIILVWWVISQLVSSFRRFYSKNDGK